MNGSNGFLRSYYMYVLGVSDDTMMMIALIDQHAACERILLEQLVNGVDGQALCLFIYAYFLHRVFSLWPDCSARPDESRCCPTGLFADEER